MTDDKIILLSAGGTGGHLFPALALAEELLLSKNKVQLITDTRCQKYINKDLGFKVNVIDFYLKMNSIFNKIISLYKIIFSCFKHVFLIKKISPKVIIGFGGYTSFPAIFAARILNIPYVLVELNCFLGKANRLFTDKAHLIALTYKETVNVGHIHKDKIIYTGDLVRSAIRNLPIKDNFNKEVFKIFVFGGSQGAKIFSELIPTAIEKILQSNPNTQIEIIQQAKIEDHDRLNNFYQKLRVKHTISDFFHNIHEIYADSDLAITRSGSGTVAELVTIGLPSIFIPFPYAMEDHQYYNAKALEDSGASWCCRQETLTPEILANKILALINNRKLLINASENMIKRKSNGTKYLADTVLKIIQ